MLRRVWKALSAIHVAVAGLYLALVWGGGLSLSSILLTNLGECVLWTLPLAPIPFAPVPWLFGGDPGWRGRPLLWVWAGVASVSAPLWMFFTLISFNDLQVGNGDHPLSAVDVGDGSQFVCFRTYDLGALGGAWLRPALVRDVLPGVERRKWPDVTSEGFTAVEVDGVSRLVSSVTIGGSVVKVPNGFRC
jgi:hypothetical protein